MMMMIMMMMMMMMMIIMITGDFSFTLKPLVPIENRVTVLSVSFLHSHLRVTTIKFD